MPADKILRYGCILPTSPISTVTFDTDLAYQKTAGWTNYPKGMLYELSQAGFKMHHGFDLYVQQFT